MSDSRAIAALMGEIVANRMVMQALAAQLLNSMTTATASEIVDTMDAMTSSALGNLRIRDLTPADEVHAREAAARAVAQMLAQLRSVPGRDAAGA